MDDDEIRNMTQEELHAYNVLQTWIVFLDNLFCIALVAAITLLAYTTGNWKLMWFYLLPVFAFVAV